MKKKILLFLSMALVATFNLWAVQPDIVLADYEVNSAYPDRTSGENGGNLQKYIANPHKDGVNGSDQVASYNFADTWWGGVHLQSFDEPISLGTYPYVTMKILSDTAKSRKVEVTVKDINDLEKSVEYTLPATTLQSGGGWSNVVFDFSTIAQNSPISLIKEIRIRVEIWKPAGVYYIDDIRFTGPKLTVSGTDVVTAFKEEFSGNGWWGAGGGTPMDKTIAYFRSASWGGSALSAAASYYTPTDSFSMAMDGWSGQTSGYFYPAISKPNLSYLTIKNIGIGGLQNLALSYSLKWISGPANFSLTPTIEYSFDGTAWAAATTTSTLPSGTGTWTTGISHPLSGVLGSTIFVRITNNTTGTFLMDNISVSGNPAFVTSINVETQDGTNAINVKGATKQLVASVLPAAANQNVYWSVNNGTGRATVSNTGALTAIKNGTVSVIARALDLFGTVKGTREVVLTNQRYPVTAITVTGTGGASTITQNDGTLQMLAAYTPNDADTLDATWSIDPSDADSATISATGILTAIRNSTVKVIATATDADHKQGSIDVVITGQNTGVETVNITSGAVISTNDGTLALTASILPLKADIKEVTWSIVSVDTDTASVTGSTLKALRNGKVTVRATSVSNPTKYAEKEITISNQVLELQSLAITGADITANGGKSQMTATATPLDAENVSIAWSLSNANDSLKASISSSGEIEAFRNGSVTVVAKDINSSISTTKTVNISGQVEVSSINLTSAGGATTITTNGGKLQITAEVLPVDARINSIVWSIVSDGGGATISQSGEVTAAKNGDVWAKATATDGSGVADSFKISISGQIMLTSVDITLASATINQNDGTLTLPLDVLPIDAADISVVWSITSADADTASINPVTGVIKAKRNGTITVRATSNSNSSLYDEATVTITNQVIEPTSIFVYGAGNASTINTNDGTLALLVEVTPTDAVSTVDWSISSADADTVNISTDGIITAKRNGKVTLKAVSTVAPSISAEKEITITNQIIEQLNSIVIKGAGNASGISTNDGTLALSVEVTPAEGATTVTWSISSDDADTASISTDGIITAKRNGKVTVKAVSTVAPSISAEKEITITNQVIEPTSIVVKGAGNASGISTNDGTLAMSVEVTPADAVNTVTWSISSADADTASVSTIGVLTAKRNGKVTVKAVSTVATSISAEKEITITNQVVEPTSIVVKGAGNFSSIFVDAGTLAMSVNVTPADADKSVTWSISSNDANIASVSTSGVLTAKRDGKVTVKAVSTLASSVSGEKEITISGQIVKITGITVTGSNITTNGGTSTMTATIAPIDATAKSVTWIVSDATIAKIDATGKLTALKNGTVTVTAINQEVGSAITGNKKITISGQIVKVKGITVAGSNITTDGGTSTLTATIAPIDATEQGVTWTVSNATIATIDATGVLTALKNGTVTVTATTKEGGSVIKGTKSITISGQTVKVTGITVKGSNITTIGGTSILTATIAPTTATEKGVTWTVSDATIATIDATGKLTALKNGTVTVTATTIESGSTVKGTKEITITGQNVAIQTNSIAFVNIYPNPATESIRVSGNSDFKSIDILNIDGKLVNRLQNVEANSEINVSNLPSGLYILRLTTTTNSFATKQFVKK